MQVLRWRLMRRWSYTIVINYNQRASSCSFFGGWLRDGAATE
jgi:hypothetical protein